MRWGGSIDRVLVTREAIIKLTKRARFEEITRPLQAEARVAWHSGTHVAKLSDWKQGKEIGGEAMD